MLFGKIDNEMNIEESKQMIDSILNVDHIPSIVVDRSTFEILYENAAAIELLGNKVERACHDILNDRPTPCMDCPLKRLSNRTTVVDRYTDLLEQVVQWQYTRIKWFDGRDAVLATLLSTESDKSPFRNDLASRIVRKVQDDQSMLDPLTHIPNYEKYYADVENAIKYNPERDYAMVVFDINRFKSINDIYGLKKGDEALCSIAKALETIFHGEGNYSRLHSDRFSFYMQYEKKGEIIKVIEKLRKLINVNSFDFDMHTSFGIYLIQDRTVPVNLMCDRAMMASKTVKDNILRFCAFYDEQYREDMIKANEIEQDMDKALENHEFKMYLQPKYNLADNSLCGAEVLCRWLHPEKGLVPPNDFIPIFERNGFILKLDMYMWEAACATIRAWLDEGRKPVPLSVNISRYHIRHNNLVEVFGRLLREYKLEPHMLTLEITESLFLDKPKELNTVLVELQNMGFRLEVDDFGSGFSSLNMIRNISVDTIKMDKDFLDNEIATEKGKIVVNHTINMAKDLHLQVVAEGVETKEHVEFLKNSNCDVAQGFYFAKPMPVSEFNLLEF